MNLGTHFYIWVYYKYLLITFLEKKKKQPDYLSFSILLHIF